MIEIVAFISLTKKNIDDVFSWCNSRHYFYKFTFFIS